MIEETGNSFWSSLWPVHILQLLTVSGQMESPVTEQSTCMCRHSTLILLHSTNHSVSRPPPFLPSYRTASPASHRPCRVREVNVHCACLRCPGTHFKLSPRHISCLSPPRRFKIPTKKEKKKEKGTAAVSPPTCPQKHPR